MKRLAFIVLTLTLTLTFMLSLDRQVAAQQKIPAQKEELIREFLSLTGNTEDMQELSSMMLRLQHAESEKLLAAFIDEDKVLSSAEKEELKKTAAESSKRVMDRIEEYYAKELDLVQLLYEVALPVYAENFTDAELRELVAFYKTSAGQKSVRIAPRLMTDTMRVFSEKYLPKLTEFIKKVTAEEAERMKQKLDAGASKKPTPKT